MAPLVPGSEVVLEPGMVLMCEPGAYDPEIGGVRLKWMFLVTENGNEVLESVRPHHAAGRQRGDAMSSI